MTLRARRAARDSFRPSTSLPRATVHRRHKSIAAGRLSAAAASQPPPVRATPPRWVRSRGPPEPVHCGGSRATSWNWSRRQQIPLGPPGSPLPPTSGPRSYDPPAGFPALCRWMSPQLPVPVRNRQKTTRRRQAACPGPGNDAASSGGRSLNPPPESPQPMFQIGRHTTDAPVRRSPGRRIPVPGCPCFPCDQLPPPPGRTARDRHRPR